MHVSQQSYTRLLLFLSLIYQAAAAPLQSSLLGTARPSLQALPSCPLPSPNTLPPNLPINADGSFILSNINLPTPPNCLFYSAPLDVDKQFLLVISSSSNVVIHVWRVGAPNEESWDSSLYLDPSGTTAFYNYVTARPNANATNTSSCAGRICNYIISVSAASGGTSQTNLQGGIGRMLEYGATAISDSLTNSQVKFFAVKCQSSNLPVQISLVSSAWVSQTIAVDMFVLPLPRPFLQTYPTTNNLLPTQFPSNQYAYISNDPAYYVDGIYLIQVLVAPYVRGSAAYGFSISAISNYTGSFPAWAPPQQSSSSAAWLGANTAVSGTSYVLTVLIVVISVIVLLLIIYLVVIWFRARRSQRIVDIQDLVEMRQSQQRLQRDQRDAAMLLAQRGSSRDLIDSLPTFIYSRSRRPEASARASDYSAPDAAPPESEQHDDTCSICMGEYVPGEELRVLPCAHWFHQECIDQWLKGSKFCPLCQQNIENALNVHNEPTSPTAALAQETINRRFTGSDRTISPPPPPVIEGEQAYNSNWVSGPIESSSSASPSFDMVNMAHSRIGAPTTS